MKFSIEKKAKNIIYQYSRIFVFTLVCGLIAACAQVVSPGGGTIDKTPPKVLKYTPDSASLNFKAAAINILFDEFIALKDLNSQLIISPPLEHLPVITVKGKTVMIEFDKKEILKPHTTYSISFGNAIQDLNENNPREDFKYIFSTGSFIDSLVVNGSVQNAFNHKTEKGILVLLYKNQNDSAVYNQLPDYFSKTNESGAFQISNVKAGAYKAVALKDANANYRYNKNAEDIGFADSIIHTDHDNTLLLNLFQEQPDKIYLKKFIQEQYGKYTLILNTRTDSLQVARLNNAGSNNDQVQAQVHFSKNNDTITYWLNNYGSDSLKLQLKRGAQVIDTAYFKAIKKEDALKAKRNPFKLSLVNSLHGNMEVDLNADIVLQFSHPISNIAANAQVYLKEDSLEYKKQALAFYKTSASDNLKISVGLKDSAGLKNKGNRPFKNDILKENTRYHLYIPPHTFTDFFGLTNDSIKIDFKTREEKFYGSVKLNLSFTSIKGSYIVQLLDEKENVIRESSIAAPAIIDYTYLHPQLYKLKIIVDENSNGKWDSGNYLLKQQPEKVFYNGEPVNIRSNWDLDLEWNIGP